MANQWSVKKLPATHPRHPGEWGVYDGRVIYDWADGPCLHDVFPTLKEAHTYATQLAVADTLFEPGGLTWLAALQGRAKVGSALLDSYAAPQRFVLGTVLDPPVVW